MQAYELLSASKPEAELGASLVAHLLYIHLRSAAITSCLFGWRRLQSVQLQQTSYAGYCGSSDSVMLSTSWSAEPQKDKQVRDHQEVAHYCQLVISSSTPSDFSSFYNPDRGRTCLEYSAYRRFYCYEPISKGERSSNLDVIDDLILTDARPIQTRCYSLATLSFAVFGRFLDFACDVRRLTTGYNALPNRDQGGRYIQSMAVEQGIARCNA